MDSLYQKALDAMPDAVFIVDEDYRVRYHNKLFAELFSSAQSGVKLGDAIRCGEQCGACGSGKNCGACGLRAAVAEAKNSPFGIYRGAVRKTVADGELIADLSFDISVCSLGTHHMGVLSNLRGTGEEDIERAAKIQRGFLPDRRADVGTPFDYIYLPIRRVGGDLLDVYREKDRACAFVADVSGKGVTAAMLTSFVKANFRRDLPFARAFRNMQKDFCKLKTDDRSYVTMLALSWNADTQRATFCSAGHSLPLLHKSGEKVVCRYAPAPPVSGWFDDVKYRSHTVKAKAGDLFVLSTDGVTDLVGKTGETFGLERLAAALEKANGANEFLRILQGEIKDFCERQTDDLTVLCVEAK